MKAIGAALALPLVMAEWLSAGRHSRVIIDDQQRVLWHNPNFSDFLSRSRALKMDRDVIVLSNKREQTALADFMRSESEQQMVIWLSDGSGQPQAVLQGQRLQTPMVSMAFGLRIADGDDYLAADYHDFDKFFGLTRQEAAICRLKLQGKTVQDIVESEGKSNDTVRFHIRNIYRKVGVSSREELFANLRHFLFN